MFSVRQAAEDDWQAIGALFVAAGRAAWTHIMTPESLETFAPPAAWLELIRAGQGLVVCVQDHPVGFSALRASQDDDAAPKTGEIASFYTHPDVWGQGAGRLLMQESLLQLSRMGFSDATLWTEERNYRPRRFYEKGAWELDGAVRERVVRGSPLRELRYRRLVP